MYWNNWIPEITLMAALLIQLIVINIRKTFFGLMPASLPVLVVVGLIAHFRFSTEVTPSEMTSILALAVDPWSYFGRTLGLLALALSMVQIFVARDLPFLSKLRTSLLSTFAFAFIDVLVLAKVPLLFGMAWSGMMVSVAFLIGLDSSLKSTRAAVFRTFAVLISIIFVGFIIQAFEPNNIWIVFMMGVLLCMVLATGTIWIRSFLVESALVMTLGTYAVFISGAFYWIRFGNQIIQTHSDVIALLFSISSVLAAWVSFRCRSEFIWLGSSCFSVMQLGWMGLLLSVSVAHYNIVGFGLLLATIHLISGLGFRYQDRPLIQYKILTAALIAGVPPLFSGSLYFNLIKDTHQRGGLLFPIAVSLVWFLLAGSSVQMVGRLLSEKKIDLDSSFWTLVEKVVFVLFLIGVIGLTWKFDELITLLTSHS